MLKALISATYSHSQELIEALNGFYEQELQEHLSHFRANHKMTSELDFATHMVTSTTSGMRVGVFGMFYSPVVFACAHC